MIKLGSSSPYDLYTVKIKGSYLWEYRMSQVCYTALWKYLICDVRDTLHRTLKILHLSLSNKLNSSRAVSASAGSHTTEELPAFKAGTGRNGYFSPMHSLQPILRHGQVAHTVRIPLKVAVPLGGWLPTVRRVRLQDKTSRNINRSLFPKLFLEPAQLFILPVCFLYTLL